MSTPILTALGIGVRVGAVSATGGIAIGVASIFATVGTLYYYKKYFN